VKSHGRITWLVRGALGLGALLLVGAALGSRPATDATPPTATELVIEVAAAPPTLQPATPRPTATSEPVVERIISRIARETQAPYPTSTAVPAGLAFVNVVDFGYMPSVTRIHVGETVVWSNGGREAHDVTGDDDWHSGPIEAPVEYRHTFGFEGSFNYRCSVHLDMRGTIIVLP
jgi:plastocyanin